MKSKTFNSRKKYLLILGAILFIEFIVLAVNPYDRRDWLLENFLVLIFIGFLFKTYKKFPLSKISYTLIFVFLFLHEIGAHYTYSLVPYDSFFESVFGRTLNSILGWERNNFDRLVHFSYGLLLAYPLREMFLRIADVKGFWGYFLPLDITMSTSMIYELIEWTAAEFFGGELGAAYLGTQGDVWDAHKDMLLASTGALITMAITLLINSYLKRDFTKEWIQSLKVKHPEPLGEEEIKHILKKK
ncbi:MAG: DUF2238 domain-containing protein [bacterium]